MASGGPRNGGRAAGNAIAARSAVGGVDARQGITNVAFRAWLAVVAACVHSQHSLSIVSG